MYRAGLTVAERQDINSAFRIIYRSGMLREDALRELQDPLTTVAGRTLLEFMSLDSARGVRRGSRSLRRAA